MVAQFVTKIDVKFIPHNNFYKIVGYAPIKHDESALWLVSGWNDFHVRMKSFSILLEMAKYDGSALFPYEDTNF